MMNIQNEVQKIHNQYGMSEKANYKIQLLCEQYAKEYHDSEVKKLNIPAVVGRSEQLVCDHPDEAIIRDKPTDYCMACNSNI
ncbi:MAG: hypothetical protein PHS38_07985 [Bacteroidales bacterium]|nr:hypothetical protein [Bacteroidales bacterium]